MQRREPRAFRLHDIRNYSPEPVNRLDRCTTWSHSERWVGQHCYSLHGNGTLWLSITFKTAGTQTITARDVDYPSITGSNTLMVGLARCAYIPPPWTQPCRPSPVVSLTNQRSDSIVVFLIFNAGDQDEYQIAPNSTLCAYAFEAFNSYQGVVDDSAYFKVTTTQFVQKALSGWTVADSTPTADVWRAAADSALQLTVFADTTVQGVWHIGTSFAPLCQGAVP